MKHSFPCALNKDGRYFELENLLWLVNRSENINEILIIKRKDCFQFQAYLKDDSTFISAFKSLQDACEFANMFSVPFNINLAWEKELPDLKYINASGRG
jgi:hypothetical protein